jgi:hypothetical protein
MAATHCGRDLPEAGISVIPVTVLPVMPRIYQTCVGRSGGLARISFLLFQREQIPAAIVVTPSLKPECDVMRKLSAVAFIIFAIAAPLPAMAYTQEDADACTPDAMRLCQQAIPDSTRITQCLVQNLRQLSPACTQAFYRIRAANRRERSTTVRKTRF